MTKTMVINFFGGPGAGKSTAALITAGELKKHKDLTVEYVSEFAKDLIYEGKVELLNGTVKNQRYLYEKQKERIDRLLGKVDIIITDSPIILSHVYLKEKGKAADEFKKQMLADNSKYINFNVCIERASDAFEQEGRIHDENQSKALDNTIEDFLKSNKIFYVKHTHETVSKVAQNALVSHKRLSEKGKMKSSREEWNRKVQTARTYPITQLIEERGFTLKPISSKVLTTEEHDSIRIFPNTNSYYRFSTEKGGTAIDFLVNECQMDFQTAVLHLADKLGIENEIPKAAKTKQEKPQEKPAAFALPKKAENNKRVYAYLASRGLSGDLIHDFIKKGLLYESAEKHNCVFVGRNEKGIPEIGMQRGTYSFGNAFKGDVAGSNYKYAVIYSAAEKPTKVYVFEAPIDMMSYIALYGAESTAAYLAMGSTTKRESLKHYICGHPEITEICVRLDNDEAGLKAAHKIKDEFQDLSVSIGIPKHGKDWNEQLMVKKLEEQQKKDFAEKTQSEPKYAPER